MKHSTWFRIAFLPLVAVAALVMPQPALANPIVPFTLAFEREGLDLDTGTIVPIELWTVEVNPTDPQPDLVLGYNSERTVCAVYTSDDAARTALKRLVQVFEKNKSVPFSPSRCGGHRAL